MVGVCYVDFFGDLRATACGNEIDFDRVTIYMSGATCPACMDWIQDRIDALLPKQQPVDPDAQGGREQELRDTVTASGYISEPAPELGAAGGGEMDAIGLSEASARRYHVGRERSHVDESLAEHLAHHRHDAGAVQFRSSP